VTVSTTTCDCSGHAVGRPGPASITPLTPLIVVFRVNLTSPVILSFHRISGTDFFYGPDALASPNHRVKALNLIHNKIHFVMNMNILMLLKVVFCLPLSASNSTNYLLLMSVKYIYGKLSVVAFILV